MKRLVCVFLLAACGGSDDGAVDAAVFDAPPAMGRFSFSWTLSDGTNPVTCADVGATSVTLAVASQVTGSGFPESFSCDVGMGTSRLAEVGTYRIDAKLRDSSGNVLVTLPTLVGVALEEGTTTVPPLEFEIPPPP